MNDVRKESIMINLEKYRDKILAEDVDNVIGFYTREFYCLDNFSSFKVLYEGHLYATVEEAYQAAGFMGSDENVVKMIQKCYSADESKRIAHEFIDKRRKDWDEVKLSIMEELLRLKIKQNPYVRKKLLMTENYPIVEDSPVDAYWGWGPEKNGQNHLGKLWMKLRDKLRNGEFDKKTEGIPERSKYAINDEFVGYLTNDEFVDILKRRSNREEQ